MFRSAKPTSTLQHRDTYIPPHIENAMADHVQQSMPAHLKKYRGGNTFIPEHAQNEMTQHLESSLPAHMKQYAGAYMQQRVVEPSLARRGSATPPAAPDNVPPATPHAPVVSPNLQNPTTGPQASYVQSTNQNQSPDQPYAFITNPEQLPKQSKLIGFFSNGSMAIRIGLVAGSLLVLLVIFTILRGLLSSTPNLDSFLTVAQEQQELIHLVDNASKESSLAADSQNLAATMQASLTTSQTATIQYLTTNHRKVDVKQLNLKVSTATDNQLADATAAGTYNQTFREIMEAKLAAYGNTLSQAYKQDQGPKGKALLSDEYRQLQLFQTQFNATAN